METERRTAPPMPCAEAQVLGKIIIETPLPDGRVRVSREVYFIDARGQKDWVEDQWTVPAP